jgi:hypothetical protein
MGGEKGEGVKNTMYVAAATNSAPIGAVVIFFGDEDEPWCHSTPCYGIAIEVEHEYNGQSLELGKRTINTRAVPVIDGEFGLGPHELDEQMMLVTPQTTSREIDSKMSSADKLDKKHYENVYSAIITELARVGIYPQ